MSFGSDPPEDNSVQLRQMEIDEENRRREEQAAKDAAAKSEFDTRVSGAFGTAQEDARANLATRGLDENEFMPIIMRALQSKRTGIPNLDPDPYSYFSSAADSALLSERDSRRGRFTNSIDKFAPFGFAENRIEDTLDDDIITGTIDEDYNRALSDAERTRDRGVITDAGLQGVIANLGRQRSGINARLQDTGAGILEEGRQSLRNKANTGRQAAGSYELGQIFDPLETENQINQDYTNFRGALSDRFKGKIGTSPLFDLSDLLNTAGKAQGALNTKQVGNLVTQPEDEDEERGLGTSGVF